MILWSTINDQFLGLKEAFSWWTKVNFLRNLNPLEVNKNWINDIQANDKQAKNGYFIACKDGCKTK